MEVMPGCSIGREGSETGAGACIGIREGARSAVVLGCEAATVPESAADPRICAIA